MVIKEELPSEGTVENTEATSSTASVEEFIETVFKNKDAEERVVVVHPVKWFKDGEEKEGQKNYRYSKNSIIHTLEESWYVGVASVRDQPSGKMIRRRTEDLRHAHCLVCDDVLTKCKIPPSAPSWIIETSEGNYQYGYMLSEPFDISTPEGYAVYDGSLRGLAAAGYNDPGAIGGYRIVRVPGSLHKTGFVGRLTAWNPERTWSTPLALLHEMGVEPHNPKAVKAPPKVQGETPPLSEGSLQDAAFDWLLKEGHILQGPGNSEWYEIECPNAHEHTGSSVAYYSPNNFIREGRQFKCHHGHCQDIKTPQFMTWVEESGGPKDAYHQGDIPDEWPVFRPLTDNLLPVEKFEPEMVPKALVAFIQNTAHRFDNTAPDYVAVSCLVTLASLVGGKALIQPKKRDTGWLLELTIWGMLVGNPSSKKSPAYKAILAFINDLLEPKLDQYDSDKKDYDTDLSIYKSKCSALEGVIKQAVKQEYGMVKGKLIDKNEAELALHHLTGEKPQEPLEPRHILNDASVESVLMFLAKRPEGMLLCRDELAGLISRLEDERYQADRNFYLECFNGFGNWYHQDRVGRDDVMAANTILSILGCITASKLIPLISDRATGKVDDGFLERFQLCVCPDIETEYTDVAPDLEAYAEASRVFKRLYEMPYLERDELVPHTFSPEAQTIFEEYCIELKQKEAQATTQEQARFAKHPALLARLSLLFHLCDGIEGVVIGKQTIIQAQGLVEYLNTHMARILALGTDPHRGAKILLMHLSELDSPFTASDFRNKDWKSLKTGKQRTEALEILVNHGYLVTSVVKKGERSTTHYHINPNADIDV